MFTSTPSSGHSPGFGQYTRSENPFAAKTTSSTNAFGSSTGTSSFNGTPKWAFGETSSPFSQSSTSVEGSSISNPQLTDCDGQRTGSRVAVYKKSVVAESSEDKLVSISAMPVYRTKSHEELRWEDYHLNRKGGFGLNSSAVMSSGLSPFSSSWGATSVSTTPVRPNLFATPLISSVTPTTTWNFPGPTTNAFTGQPLSLSSSLNTSLATVTAAPLNLFTPFVTRTTSTASSTSSASISLAPLNHNPFTKPFHSPASASSTSSASISLTPWNHNPFTIPFISPATQTSSSMYSSPTFAAITSHLTNTPISVPSISTVTAAADPVLVSPVSSGLSLTSNQLAALSKPSVSATHNCNWAIPGGIGPSFVVQLPSSHTASTEKPSSAANPYGTLPPRPEMFLGGSRGTPSTKYGISSIPVQDKPSPVRSPSVLTTRHLTRRSKRPVSKHDPKHNGPKMPFFSDTEIPVDVFVPRENPRALIVCPEKWPPRAVMKNTHEENLSVNKYPRENGDVEALTCPDDVTEEKEAVPAKIKQSEYYTQPQISELEAKERNEPGFCRHVRDFVIGRRGYGSIKFLGETDVRNLDLETYVQFNNRDVIVYMDESKKPPVGEGLNKPAEVTLLNIKCIDKRTGMQYTDGSRIDKYTEMLKKKAVGQGAEFVSYDPIRGEWKFNVQHF